MLFSASVCCVKLPEPSYWNCVVLLSASVTVCGRPFG